MAQNNMSRPHERVSEETHPVLARPGDTCTTCRNGLFMTDDMTDWLSDWMSDDILEQLIESLEESGKIMVFNRVHIPQESKRDTLFNRFIQIKCTCERGKRSTEKSFIIKCEPSWQDLQTFAEYCKMSTIEYVVHNEWLPSMYYLYKTSANQKSKPVAPLAFGHPICTSFLLEDLRVTKYKRLVRSSRLDYDHARQVLSTLARMHAMSRALLVDTTDVFQMVEEFIFVEKEKSVFQAIEYHMKVLSNEVKSWKGFERFGPKLDKVSKCILNKLIAMKSARFTRFPVLNHGDCWTRNIFFHYSGNSKEVNDALFINFNFARLCSPVLDILNFLYSSVQEDVLFEFWDELLAEYHNVLYCCLKDLKFNAADFTLQNLKQEADELRLYGFFVASTYLQVSLTERKVFEDCLLVRLFAKEEGDNIMILDGKEKVFVNTFKRYLVHFEKLGVL